jgi:hypothetical protein
MCLHLAGQLPVGVQMLKRADQDSIGALRRPISVAIRDASRTN